MVILLQISFLLFNIPFQGERQYGISRIAHGLKKAVSALKKLFPRRHADAAASLFGTGNTRKFSVLPRSRRQRACKA